VVVGQKGVLLFYSFDRLVSALRLLSEEQALGDLLPTLRIEEVRSSLSARGYLLRCLSGDSRTLDRCARVAALCFGTLYVGTDRHFIAYRSRQAPLGYDVVELSPESFDYILYGASFTQTYSRIAEIPLLGVLLRLQLLPRAQVAAGGEPAALADLQDGAEELWLLIPDGLLHRVLRFLWQRGIEAAVALQGPLPLDAAPEIPTSSSPFPFHEAALLRLPPLASSKAPLAARAAPKSLLLDLPFVRALRPLSERLAVEVGHVHPLRLQSFERLFDKEQRYLFLSGSASGKTAALTLPATPFVPAERLIELHYAAPSPQKSSPGEAAPLRPTPQKEAFGQLGPPLRLQLRLLAEPTPSEPPVAALIPYTQAKTLGKLLGLLPSSLFPELRAVCIDEGILFVGDSGTIASLPLGRLFYAAAPSVLVPLGMRLVPRLRGDILQAKLGAPDGSLVIFLPGAAPFSLGKELFTPAAGSLITRLLTTQRSGPAPAPPPASIAVTYDPLGMLWPLWGGPRPAKESRER
jgi:hypothetical protein